MADKKISALTSASVPLAGSEVLPIVQGGSTVKVSVANLTVGRDVVNKTSSVSSGSIGGTFFNEANGAISGSRYWKIQNDVLAYGDWVLAQSTDNTGASYTTRLYINASGNPTVSTGNLVIGTAAKGIDFSANGGDILSQYDEGTWNVVWTNLTGTPANLVGTYTRIGRLVFFNYAAGANNLTGVAASTYFSLPFTPAAMGAGQMISENVNNAGSTLIHTGTRVYPEAFVSSFMVFSGCFYI